MKKKTELQKYIQQFLEYLEVERGRSARTIRNYDFYLTRFANWAKQPVPAKIDQDMVSKYRLYLNRNVEGREETNLKKSTQNYHLIALRSFLKFLAKKDIKTMLADKIELAKVGTRKIEFLEEDELRRMLNATKDAKGLIGKRDRAVLEMLFSTGLRVSELSELRIKEINLKRGEFTVRGKGSKHRIVFLSDNARDAVAEYLDKRMDTSPYLFVSHDRAKKQRDILPLSPRSIQRLVERYATAAGITKKITPHTLRHTCSATNQSPQPRFTHM